MKCSFCGREAEKGTGKLFIRKTGKLLYFCTMKCEKNAIKLERLPRKVKWTEAHRKVKQKKEEEA